MLTLLDGFKQSQCHIYFGLEMSRTACGVGEQEAGYKVRKKTVSCCCSNEGLRLYFVVGIAHTLV